MKLLTIDQMALYTPITQNISAKIFEPQVELTKVTDLIPTIGSQMTEQIEALVMDGADFPQLRQLFAGYIVPFMVKAVEVRLLAIHGLNWGREGLVKYQDSTAVSQPISDSERGTMIKQARSDMGAFKTILLNKLRKDAMTFDDVVYQLDEDTQSNPVVVGTIYAVGKGRKLDKSRFE
jgi:hypothetical protein